MPLSQPSDLTREEQKAVLENTAIRYLSFRPRFKAEIFTSLCRKAQELNLKDPLILINQIVISLEKSGFLNDQKLLESYIRTRLRDKIKGPYWIKPHLLHFGLNRDEVETALKVHASRSAQLEVITRFLAKKYHSLDPDLKTKAKLFRTLTARGFSADIVAVAFDQNRSGE